LKQIANPFVAMERIRYSTLAEFMDLSAESDSNFEYTVAWVDCLASGKHLGRGIFLRGNHDRSEQYTFKQVRKKIALTVPMDFPSFILGTLTVKAFNEVYYHAQPGNHVHKVVPYEPFFYPLDAISNWNRMYGKRGFLQYQCVVPSHHSYEVMKDILARISHAGQGSFLTVLKKFGEIPSPGMLSFPKPGLTLALDFAYNGKKTLQLCDQLDQVVRESDGAVYPAKDARMTAESFQAYYPQWKEFEQYRDPHFSSSFWRRVAHMERADKS
jgi:FAD/FMN-containing dehydrogenase